MLTVIVAETRLRNFVVGLSNTDPANTAPVYKQYTGGYVQHSGTVAAGDTVSLYIQSSSQSFRYVIVQNQFTSLQAICLTEVKVFVRGKFCIVLYTNILGILPYIFRICI